MAEFSDNMYACIRDIDHDLARKLAKHIWPNMPQPKTDLEAIIMLHYARARIKTMPETLRLYSHCFLRDWDIKSELDDHLKPKAERMYPVGVRAVGVSSSKIGGGKNAFNYAVQKVMSDAVLETFADGHSHQPHIVTARMMEKRAQFKKQA